MDSKHGAIAVLLVIAVMQIANAGDPNILSDFTSSPNATLAGANFFTFTGFRVLDGGALPTAFNVLKASSAQLPSLDGQSVSYAVLQFPVGSVNPPHTHPRAAELLFVVQGTLEVGLIDTTNKLYTQTLQRGDLFVFPKGLVHYQYNADKTNFASAVSAFGSASAGTVSIPTSVFATGIPDIILAAAFKTDVPTIQAIKVGLANKA